MSAALASSTGAECLILLILIVARCLPLFGLMATLIRTTQDLHKSHGSVINAMRLSPVTPVVPQPIFVVICEQVIILISVGLLRKKRYKSSILRESIALPVLALSSLRF